MKTKRLTCITADNHNKFYNMTENDDGTFTVEYGRIDQSSRTTTYPMSRWETIYNQKISRGYTDVTELYIVGNSVSEVKKTSSPLDKVIVKLQKYAKAMVELNYKISTQSVTPKMIVDSQEVIDFVARYVNNFVASRRSTIDLDVINSSLLKLFTILPRKMKKVQDYLVSQETLNGMAKDEMYHELNRIIRREQATLDALSATVSSDNPETEDLGIMDQLGITMKEKDADLEEMVLRMLGDIKHKYSNCWYVTNTSTQERFDANLKSRRGVHKKVMFFWHGSKNENWLSIIKNGLMIRPSGVATTGSMFGDGLYFADRAKKSYNYTSGRGSYYAHGDSKVAYMAIFSVNVGKYHKVRKHTSECYGFSKAYLKKKGNFDSVYAIKGIDLVNDEYIAYDPAQCTIHALVELKCD